MLWRAARGGRTRGACGSASASCSSAACSRCVVAATPATRRSGGDGSMSAGGSKCCIGAKLARSQLELMQMSSVCGKGTEMTTSGW